MNRDSFVWKLYLTACVVNCYIILLLIGLTVTDVISLLDAIILAVVVLFFTIAFGAVVADEKSKPGR